MPTKFITSDDYTSPTTLASAETMQEVFAGMEQNGQVKSIDFISLQFCMLNFLQKMHHAMSPTILVQMYWNYCPLKLSFEIQRKLEQEVDQRALDEFNYVTQLLQCELKPSFCMQDCQLPHVMAAFGTVQMMRLLNVLDRFKSDGNYVAYVKELMKSLFHEQSGGFRAHLDGEVDARITYCATFVIDQLGLMEDLEIRELLKRTWSYLIKKLTYQRGMAGAVGEAHSAYLYCGLAGIQILINNGFKEEFFSQTQLMDALLYMAQRQTAAGGFNGRTNKHVDGCYSWWTGAALTIVCRWLKQYYQQEVKAGEILDLELFNKYVYQAAQDPEGGLRDKPGENVDRYHTCYVLMGWAILNQIVDFAPETGF